MAGDYWRQVASRSWRESREAVRWDNWLRIVIALAPLFIAAVATWVVVGDAAGNIVRLLSTIGATAAIAALLFLAKLITVPAKMHAELLEKVAPTSPGPDFAIKDLFHHIVSEQRARNWKNVGLGIQDELSICRLKSWGRRLRDDCAGPLESIPAKLEGGNLDICIFDG